MNVTTEIRNKIQSMGAGGSTRQDYLSTNKSLNFSGGSNNINTAPAQRVSAIPTKLNFKDPVGLSGAENIFVKVDLNILNSSTVFANIDAQENTYYPVWQTAEEPTTNDYDTAFIDFSVESPTSSENTFKAALFNNDLSAYGNPIVSVDMTNLKTGNKYIDNWLDVVVYTRDGQRIDNDNFYISTKDFFYIGFHARNTRRIPVNVEMNIGKEFYEKNLMSEAQKKLII
jgi:hypothetical protein